MCLHERRYRCIVYVDDGIIITNKDSSIYSIIDKLKVRYQLIEEEKNQNYLGIYVKQ